MDQTVRAELYLRLLVERSLLDGARNHPFGGPVLSAATALTAAGAIERGLAKRIVADFDVACQLRSRGGPAFPSNNGTAPASPKPVRFVPCDTVVELSGWRVRIRYALLREDLTVLGLTATTDQQLPGSPHHVPSVQPQLSDDQGHATSSAFGGGGSPGEYDGILEATTPLSADTRWISVGPHRIDLPDPPTEPPRARIERLPEADSALAHLWNRLATRTRPMRISDEDIGASVDALVHVGAIDTASPEIAQLLAASQVVGHLPMTRGLVPSVGAPPSTALPEPWASLAATLGRRSPRGPTGMLAVGAVTPSIDGTTVVMVEAVESDPDGFHIRVATIPPISLHHGAWFDEFRIAWWAEDDRGGTYLGATGNWRAVSEISHGTVDFWPALDHRCKQLTFMPTGMRERAVIPIALDWGGTR